MAIKMQKAQRNSMQSIKNRQFAKISRHQNENEADRAKQSTQKIKRSQKLKTRTKETDGV